MKELIVDLFVLLFGYGLGFFHIRFLINQMAKENERAGIVRELIDWVKSSDRLPEDGIDVLIYANRKVRHGYFVESEGKFYCHEEFARALKNVTHWAEMPKGVCEIKGDHGSTICNAPA